MLPEHDLRRKGSRPRAKRYTNVPDFLASGSAAIEWAEQNHNALWDDEFVREELEGWAWKYSEFARSAYRDGSIVVYRAVRVPVIHGTAEVNFDCAGKAWSKERRGAEPYNAGLIKRGEKDVVIQGVVEPTDVDWEYGFHSFLYYGPEQWEVSMIEGSPVLVTHVDDVKLPMPIEANTGPAGEDWHRECGKRKSR